MAAKFFHLQESAKNAKQEEDEKSAFSGRKSRKERRILKERKLAGRIPSPPSYATYDSSKKGSSKWHDSNNSSSSSSSRSASPVNHNRWVLTARGHLWNTSPKVKWSRGSSFLLRGVETWKLDIVIVEFTDLKYHTHVRGRGPPCRVLSPIINCI